MDESRKIFAKRPRREFLNSDHLEDDISTIWALSCTVWHSMHFSSYHNEEAADLSTCLYNEKIVSFFSIGSGSLPKHKQKKHDQILVDGDTNGVTHDRVLICQQNIFFPFQCMRNQPLSAFILLPCPPNFHPMNYVLSSAFKPSHLRSFSPHLLFSSQS